MHIFYVGVGVGVGGVVHTISKYVAEKSSVDRHLVPVRY